MRVIFLWLGSLFIMNCGYASPKDSLISINYRMLPEVTKYGPGYKILSNVNSDLRPVYVNYSLQNFIKKENFSDSTLLE